MWVKSIAIVGEAAERTNVGLTKRAPALCICACWCVYVSECVWVSVRGYEVSVYTVRTGWLRCCLLYQHFVYTLVALSEWWLWPTVHKMLKLWLWRWCWARRDRGQRATELAGNGNGNDCGRAEPEPEPEHTHKKVSNGNFELMNETKRNELNWFHLCAAALNHAELSSELFLPSCPLSVDVAVAIVALLLCRFLAFLSWKYFRPERKRLIKPKEFLCNFVLPHTTQQLSFENLLLSTVERSFC